MGVISFERDRSAEFSDLYMRMLNAALDEMNSSPSPEHREQNLAAHVVRAIAMNGPVSDWLS
jgi:hypothetical protein